MARKAAKRKAIIERECVKIKPFCTALKCAMEIASNSDNARPQPMHGVIIARLADHCRGGGLHVVACDGHRVGAFALDEPKEVPWVLPKNSEGPDFVWLSKADAKVVLATLNARVGALFEGAELHCEVTEAAITFSSGGTTLATVARDITCERDYPPIWNEQITGPDLFAHAIAVRLSAEYLRQVCIAAKAIDGKNAVGIVAVSDTDPALCVFTETKGFVVIMPVRG